MIKSNILQRVLHVKYGDSVGSAFTMDLENKQFLISARHIFKGLAREDTIEIMQDWIRKPLHLKPIFCDDGVDIIIFPLENNITPAHPVEPTMNWMYISQDAYFLGFPYMLKTEVWNLNNNCPVPFVKKCIVSMYEFSSTPKIIYLDGHNNPGFSGGPLVFFHPETKNIQIAWVISSYLYDLDQEKLSKGINENSGIFLAHSIEHVTDRIKGQ